MAGLQKLVLIFAGILIVVMGLATGGWLPVGRIFGDGAGMADVIAKGFKKLSSRKSTFVYLPLGLLLGLLPCGPVTQRSSVQQGPEWKRQRHLMG